MEFVNDAEKMWEPCGYESPDGFIRHALVLEPEEIRLAVRWLESNKPDEAISRAQQKKLDALARRAPSLLEGVRAGKKSVHRACVEAGIVKLPTQLQLLQKAWDKADKEERQAFAAELQHDGWHRVDAASILDSVSPEVRQ